MSDIEDQVRAKLEEEFGPPFGPKELVVGYKDDEAAMHEFDAVSGDESIVAEIKSGTWPTTGGNAPSAKIAGAYMDIYFLTRLGPRRKKLLILTDQQFFEQFKSISDGKLPCDVELRHIPVE